MHLFDYLVVFGYLALVVALGWGARGATANSDEGYFLAGRKLGKLYQFFLTFGNATEPQGAVSTASLVFQRGLPGVWFSFQTVFMNPYFWFSIVWYRRARLVTVADLFDDRLGARSLALFYSIFQVAVACVLLGFGNFTVYKICSSIVVKPEVQWTAVERASVDGYRELRALEQSPAPLDAAAQARLADLRDRQSRGELRTYITALPRLPFYLVFTAVVAAYIILGGMSAAAVNEALASILIIIFSVLLIPVGLSAVGGWSGVAAKVPENMLDLFGGEGSGGGLFVFAVLFASLMQIQGMSHHMGVAGSAKDEFAARLGGTLGGYTKRFLIITWAFVGLIAIAFFGVGGLADPDSAWGFMSARLLGPGLIGLMLAGVLAGTIGSLAVKTLAVSSLFVCNVWRHFRPGATPSFEATLGRWAVLVILALGVVSALVMRDFETVVVILLTINAPFGCAIGLIFFWRRLTTPAVWAAVVLATVSTLILPLTASSFHTFSRNTTLVQTAPDSSGRPVPVYFKELVRIDPNDPGSPLEGRGRFRAEIWLLSKVGLDPVRLTPVGRETAQFLFVGFFPFVVLIVVSLFTRGADPRLVDRFYGKMHTPVAANPEVDAAEMAATRADPHRFNHTKLFPGSSWEFGKWTRVDTIGFIACCAVSAAIIALFILLIHLVRTAA